MFDYMAAVPPNLEYMPIWLRGDRVNIKNGLELLSKSKVEKIDLTISGVIDQEVVQDICDLFVQLKVRRLDVVHCCIRTDLLRDILRCAVVCVESLRVSWVYIGGVKVVEMLNEVMDDGCGVCVVNLTGNFMNGVSRTLLYNLVVRVKGVVAVILDKQSKRVNEVLEKRKLKVFEREYLYYYDHKRDVVVSNSLRYAVGFYDTIGRRNFMVWVEVLLILGGYNDSCW